MKISAVPSRNIERILLGTNCARIQSLNSSLCPTWIVLARILLVAGKQVSWSAFFPEVFSGECYSFKKSSRRTWRKWQTTTNRNRKPFKSWKTLQQNWEFTRSVPHKPVNPGMCVIYLIIAVLLINCSSNVYLTNQRRSMYRC